MDVNGFMRRDLTVLESYVPGEYRPDCIKLASNENNWGPSPKVVETLREWAQKTHIYPYRNRQVRENVAVYAGVDSGNVVLGNGSDEIMDMILKVFKGPAAGSYPSFAIYPFISAVWGETYVEVPLEGDFKFNAERFNQRSKDASILFLCSPNNPTGLGIADDDVKAVLETGKLVVLDEAYAEFAGVSRAEWVRDYPNLIVLRTMAKAFALAGLRIGYAVAGEELAAALSRVRMPFNVNSLAEAAAVAALADIPYMRKCVNAINRDRDRIYEALNGRFNAVKSDANFVMADVSPMSAQQFFDRMLAENIIVRKLGRFRGYPGEYVRVSPGTAEETDRFLEALQRI
jgi:histidinol-phosphate aminotransferase